MIHKKQKTRGVACLMGVLVLGLSVGSAGVTQSAETAKDAWTKLLKPNYAKNPAFAFVSNQKNLKNVLIYGDSISMGYTPTVREELADVANVYRIHKNGGSSNFIIPVVKELEAAMRNPQLSNPWDFQWDVIQFNVGLHDLKFVTKGAVLDKENGRLVNSADRYKANLEKAVQFLKQNYPETKLVFVTTTPVPENEPGRNAGDAAIYNQAALEVLKKHPEIIINDLYSFTKTNAKQWWVKPGNVHYNAAGQKAQGKQVAKKLRDVLKG